MKTSKILMSVIVAIGGGGLLSGCTEQLNALKTSLHTANESIRSLGLSNSSSKKGEINLTYEECDKLRDRHMKQYGTLNPSIYDADYQEMEYCSEKKMIESNKAMHDYLDNLIKSGDDYK